MMLLSIYGIGLAQTRINVGDPAPYDGYILTAPELQKLSRGIRRLEALEEGVAARDSLITMFEERSGMLRSLVYDQQELIKDLEKEKSPGILKQATDSGTLILVTLLLGVRFALE